MLGAETDTGCCADLVLADSEAGGIGGSGAVMIVGSRLAFFFFSSRRRHTRCLSDWSSDLCSSDLKAIPAIQGKNVFTDITTGRIWYTDYKAILSHCHMRHKDTVLGHTPARTMCALAPSASVVCEF